MILSTSRVAGVVVALAVSGAIPVSAVLQGDCDSSGGVAIFELQRCVNIFLAPSRLAECPPCDQNADQLVDIAEVQGAAHCFKGPSRPGCSRITPPVPSPTNTIPLPPTDTPAPPPTHTPTPPPATPTATATTAVEAVCGNGIVETGETCDDGNLLNGDACPSNCIILSCVPAGSIKPVDVNFRSTVPLVSITVFLDYPDGKLQIPGTGTAPTVGQRVVNRLPGLATFVDRDYGLRAAISGASPFQTNRIFTVNFDECRDAGPVTAADFDCTVIEAVNQSFQNVPGVTCSVSFP